MTYHKGYFKALLDVLHLLEKMESSFVKSQHRFVLTKAVIEDVLKNHKTEYFSKYGGDIQFKYKIEKGKVVFMEVGEVKE